MSADDAIYSTAMLMFAALPVLSMRSPSRRTVTRFDPAKVTAAIAFVLLLWLQLRKQYQLGVILVAINLLLRLYELIYRRKRRKSLIDF